MRQRDDTEARYAEPRDDLDRDGLDRDDPDRDGLDRDDPDHDDPDRTDLERDPDGIEPQEAEVQEAQEVEAREAEIRAAEVREDEAVGLRGDADEYPDGEGTEPYRDPDTGTYRSAAAEPAEIQTGVAPVGDSTDVGEPDTGTPSTAMPSSATPSAMMPSTTMPSATMPSATMPSSDGALWPEGETSGFQDRWREVQLRFVDDPRGAADDAEALVGEVIDQFTAAVTARKRELDAWRDNAEGADTEQMRMAVRQYRQLLDRVFGV